MALMEDERLILRWLSQYGPLRWPQIRGLLYYRPQRSVNRLADIERRRIRNDLADCDHLKLGQPIGAGLKSGQID